VDITKESMEVGPTMHYIMGGVRVDADTTATTVPGLYAAGEVAAGLHGANRLGGNSLSDLLVFGRRAGQYAAEYAQSSAAPVVDTDEAECTQKNTLAPFDSAGDENPYTLQADLQGYMQQLVGIIRVEAELRQALERIDQLNARLERVKVQGNRQYNPAWHLSLDMRNMLTVSKAITLSAIERKESRGGHTRDDFPNTDSKFARVNVVTRITHGETTTALEPLPEMPEELKQIVEDKA
jgi:succinate dehydrogenase / fumarate reductase flavoprotein subunit